MFIGAVYNGINLPASFESFIFVRETIRSLFYSNLEVNGTQRISWLAKEKRETYGAEENREKCLIGIDESRRFFSKSFTPVILLAGREWGLDVKR
jgi:hypothetical protein